MNNQILCDLFFALGLSYLALCLCMIGRPSMALKYLFWWRRRDPFLGECIGRRSRICSSN